MTKGTMPLPNGTLKRQFVQEKLGVEDGGASYLASEVTIRVYLPQNDNTGNFMYVGAYNHQFNSQLDRKVRNNHLYTLNEIRNHEVNKRFRDIYFTDMKTQRAEAKKLERAIREEVEQEVTLDTLPQYIPEKHIMNYQVRHVPQRSYIYRAANSEDHKQDVLMQTDPAIGRIADLLSRGLSLSQKEQERLEGNILSALQRGLIQETATPPPERTL